jgi:ribosomal protein L40E
MPRGQKTCDKCGTSTGPRAFVCKECGFHFSFKAKSKEQKNTRIIKDINWRELQKGDVIKVTGGPYFYYNGEPISMGYRGRFMVEKVDDKGIRAWGIGKQSGFAHIYMGRDIQNPDTGVWKVKHKVVKLKKKEKRNQLLMN